MKTADIKTILEKFSFGPLDNYGMVISADSIPRIARKIKQLEKLDAAQRSENDRLIIAKMEELIEHIKTWKPNTLDWHDKKCQLESELQSLKDK